MTPATEATVTEPTTHTLDVPGAILTYDVRRSGSTTAPVLLLIGSPMGAAGFGTLARHFPDRTVFTYDPRGARPDRSRREPSVRVDQPPRRRSTPVMSAAGRGMRTGT